MMTTLTNFFNSMLARAEYANQELRMMLKHQCFGALVFFQEEHPELYSEAQNLWMDKYLPEFNKLIERN